MPYHASTVRIKPRALPQVGTFFLTTLIGWSAFGEVRQDAFAK
jgi:hypothetical protein